MDGSLNINVLYQSDVFMKIKYYQQTDEQKCKDWVIIGQRNLETIII